MPGPLAWLAIQGGIMVTEWAYHRWGEKWLFGEPPKQRPERISLPRSDQGVIHPLIYGTALINEPNIAWAGNASAQVAFGDEADHTAIYDYHFDILFNLGIPFRNGDQRFRRVWLGDKLYNYTFYANGNGSDDVAYPADDETSVIQLGSAALSWVTGNPPAGGVGIMSALAGSGAGPSALTAAGKFFFSDGRDSQTFDVVRDYIVENSSWTAQNIPSFRGYLTVLAYRVTPGEGDLGFKWGQSPDPTPVKFEVQSLPPNPLWSTGKITAYSPSPSIYEPFYDVNPADVIRDVIVGTFGKAELDPDVVDLVTFTAAARILEEEANGYSRYWQGGSVGELLTEILVQVDGLLREDPATEKIQLILIRNNYLVSALPKITPDNCEAMDAVELGSFENTVNRIEIPFPNRLQEYADDVGEALIESAIYSKLDPTRDAQIPMRGVHTKPLADKLAARELAARSYPISKFRAICDRSMAGILPGDVVAVTWPRFGLVDVPFRVASPARGSLGERKIELDLIQDFYYRSRAVTVGPSVPVLPPGDLDPGVG